MSSKRTRLDIIFKIDAKSSSNQLGVGVNTLDEFSDGIDDIKAIRIIIDLMRRFNFPLNFVEQGKIFSVDAYVKSIEKSGKWSRVVEAGGLSFRFGRVTALKHGFITIEEKEAGVVKSWDDWVDPFLNEKSFIQAWVSDVEYDYWQNAKDPLEYESVGKSLSGLPVKSNGFPPPLEQMEVDISNNPCRRELNDGYVQAIGYCMWVSNLFWSCVGVDKKDRLIKSDWPNFNIINGEILKIKASENTFSDASTLVNQIKLRKILFD